jgi:site-specific DNA-cytosine methylase
MVGQRLTEPSMTERALELFAGVGGFAAALSGRARVVAAYDQSVDARAAYAANFPGTRLVARNLDRVTSAELASHGAGLWWLSPPCEPYTTRGARRDLDDTRARSLLALLDAVAVLRPPRLALENVAGFADSRARSRVLAVLADAGYHVAERLLCPTALGVPMRRPRYYLAASLAPLAPERPPAPRPRPLAAWLDPEPEPDLAVPPAFAARHARAFHVVDPDDPGAVAACFGSSYGHACHGAGSVIRTPRGLRFFSPDEMARLLGLPEPFRFPPDTPRASRWRLLGNSLSVQAVREVLARVLAEAAEP